MGELARQISFGFLAWKVRGINATLPWCGRWGLTEVATFPNTGSGRGTALATISRGAVLIQEVDDGKETVENRPLNPIEFLPNCRNGLDFVSAAVS